MTEQGPTRDVTIRGVKSALDLRPEVDFEPGPMRRPLQRMDRDQEVQLERTLRTLELI